MFDYAVLHCQSKQVPEGDASGTSKSELIRRGEQALEHFLAELEKQSINIGEWERRDGKRAETLPHSDSLSLSLLTLPPLPIPLPFPSLLQLLTR